MDAYIGEVRIFLGDYAPVGWLFCRGDAVRVYDFRNLYNVIGNAFGGDSQKFNLPDLQGRTPIGAGTSAEGTNYERGKAGGAATYTLTTVPAHSHAMNGASTTVSSGKPSGLLFANTDSRNKLYGNGADDVQLNSDILIAEGSDKPEPLNNEQPFLVVSYIICAEGVFPF